MGKIDKQIRVHQNMNKREKERGTGPKKEGGQSGIKDSGVRGKKR